jgi:phosphoglycolate phosphatase-like HAD superfamily hydrolase
MKNMKPPKSLLALFCLSIGIYLAYCWLTTAPDIIVESKNITDIYTYIKPNEYNKDLLVIFDIDNTIATTPTPLGSDQWFYAMKKGFVETGKSDQEAIDHLLPQYIHIQRNTWLIPVEKDTVSVIHTLQEKGVSVIALTARSLELAHRTIEQLHHMDIYFTKTDPYECPIAYDNKKPGIYIDGIIFSGNHDKGEMLVHWFKQSNYRPKKVIFIDDKLKNLHSVEKALHNRDYPFIGIRYGYTDDLVHNFSLEAAINEQAKFFEKHLFVKPLAVP